MNYEFITSISEADLESFLPIQRARGACFLTNTTQDARLIDYRRAAYNDGQRVARATFLQRRVRMILQSPYTGSKNFGIESKPVDPDGIAKVFRLPFGPIHTVDGISYRDASGTVREEIASDMFALESGKFVRWNDTHRWASERPGLVVEYTAGFPLDHDIIPELRMAVEETLAAKWDARGGNYRMPTSAMQVFASLRTSRTYVPGS